MEGIQLRLFILLFDGRILSFVSILQPFFFPFDSSFIVIPFGFEVDVSFFFMISFN